MDTITQEQKNLEELCRAAGAGGLSDAAQTAAKLLKPYMDEVTLSPLGNVIGWRRCGKPEAPVVLLKAHIDEIGFIVTGVDDAGFVHAAPCGGVDARALSAAEVVLWADKPYPGVFCSTPPHLSDGDTALAEIPAMGIDVGMDAKKARKRIPLGTRVTFRPHFDPLLGGRVCAKALDDRAGVAAVLYAMQLLEGAALSCDVAVVFAAQEELGCRGSAVAAFAVNPACAIVTDVSFALTPDAPAAKCGELGKGPMLGWSPTLYVGLTRQLERLAEQAGIPLQHEVMGGDTGTDADSISDARAGVPTALLSIPLRYMHTPAEVIDLQDMRSVGALMAAFVQKGVTAL